MDRKNKWLIGGSLILLITFNLFNLLNFIYNFAMARLLSLSDYGTLVSLNYLIITFSIFSESIQTVISKYTTNEKESSKVKDIVIKSLKKAVHIAFPVFIFYLILSSVLVLFVPISYALFALTGLAIFFSLSLPIMRGVMQGKKRFTSLGLNLVAEGSVKLLVSLILVLMGWNVFGALVGVLIGMLSAMIFSTFSLKDILFLKRKKSRTLGIYTYTKPVFLANASIMLFLSFDILLAKIFFEPRLVGAYAIASTLAKIIFMGTQPISKALFPISTESKTIKDSQKVFMKSFVLLILCLGFSLLILYLIPDFLITIYSGKVVPEASVIILPLSIAMVLLSITNLLLLHRLSRTNLKYPYALLGFIFIEVLLLSLFHNTLLSYSWALLCSSAIFLMGVWVLNKWISQ